MRLAPIIALLLLMSCDKYERLAPESESNPFHPDNPTELIIITSAEPSFFLGQWRVLVEWEVNPEYINQGSINRFFVFADGSQTAMPPADQYFYLDIFGVNEGDELTYTVRMDYDDFPVKESRPVTVIVE